MNRRSFVNATLGATGILTVPGLAAGLPALAAEPNTLLDAEERSTLSSAWSDALKLAGTPDPKWHGERLTVTVLAQGPKSAISGPLYQVKPLWEKRTGATLDIVEVPFAEMHEKWLTDISTGAGRFDAMWIPGWFLGDFVATSSIIPIEPYLDDKRFAKWDRSTIAPQIVQLLQWGGKWYGIHNDSDAQILYYRKDVFAEPKWRSAFRAAKHYELPDPPRTWQQVIDIAEFFNGKPFALGGKAGSGVVLPLKVGQQGFFHYVALAGPFVTVPGNGGKPDKYHNVFFFDPEDMTPLINSPGALRALEVAQRLRNAGPHEMVDYLLPQGWDVFLRGDSAMIWSWGDVGALAEDPAYSKIKGLVGSAGLPGSTEWYDREQKKFVSSTAHPNVVGNSVGGSWFPVISKLSKNPDLAYDFAALQATQPMILWNVQHGWTGINPGNNYDFLPPLGTGKLSEWPRAGWSSRDAQEYLRAYEENFFVDKVGQPYLRIPGASEYFTNLDIHLSEAWSGQGSLKEALDRTAADWENTTNKIGRDKQLAFYRQSLGM